MYPCVYCNKTFMTRNDYTHHLVSDHKPKTRFQETGIFVGDTAHKTKFRKNHPVSSERSLVFMVPGLTTQAEIFNPNVVSNLRQLLHYDIALGKRISVRMLCRSLIQKHDGDTEITKGYYCQTLPVILK